VRLEELGKIKKSSDLNGNQTCKLPACSIMPQPTTAFVASDRKGDSSMQFINAFLFINVHLMLINN
jgi:hypothetical protein